MNQQSSDLLRLASEHVKGLPEGITGLMGLSEQQIDAAIDNALQAIILSAAAAESAVNIEVTRPVTCIQPFVFRRFFAELAQQACRGNIREKISFLLRNKVDLSLSNVDKEKIRYLFECRNRIIHSTPEYKEYPATEEQLKGMSPEQIATNSPILSVITISSRSTDIYDQARECFAAAKLLIDRLNASRIFGRKASNPVHPSHAKPGIIPKKSSL